MDDIIIFFSRDDQSWNNQLSFKNYLSNTQISSCSTLFRFMQAFKLHLPPNCDRNTTFWLLIKHIQKVYVLVLISTRFVATCLSEGMIPPNHQCEPVAKVRSNWEPDVRVSFHCWPDVTCMGQIQLWTSWKGQFHLWTRCKSQFPLWTRCNLEQVRSNCEPVARASSHCESDGRVRSKMRRKQSFCLEMDMVQASCEMSKFFCYFFVVK